MQLHCLRQGRHEPEPHIIIVDDEAPTREWSAITSRCSFVRDACDGGKSLRRGRNRHCPTSWYRLNVPGAGVGIRDLKTINVPSSCGGDHKAIDRVVGADSNNTAIASLWSCARATGGAIAQLPRRSFSRKQVSYGESLAERSFT